MAEDDKQPLLVQQTTSVCFTIIPLMWRRWGLLSEEQGH